MRRGGTAFFIVYDINFFIILLKTIKGVINMSTLPTFESILLEINQSFGGISFSTNKKRKFATRRMQEKVYQKMFNDIFEDISCKLKLDDDAKSDIYKNLLSANLFFKSVELNTWTGNAWR